MLNPDQFMGRKGKLQLYQDDKTQSGGEGQRVDKSLAEFGCLSREILDYENVNCYHSFRCRPMP